MKIAICEVIERRIYSHYDDYDSLYKLIPETEFEEVSEERFKEILEHVEINNGDYTKKKYAVLGLDTKKHLDEIVTEIEKENKERAKEKRKRDLAEQKRQAALKKNALERKRKQLEKLKEELGEN